MHKTQLANIKAVVTLLCTTEARASFAHAHRMQRWARDFSDDYWSTNERKEPFKSILDEIETFLRECTNIRNIDTTAVVAAWTDAREHLKSDADVALPKWSP